MADTKRPASVGKEWLAWWALRGDEPLDCLTEYFAFAHDRLGQFVVANREHLSPEDEQFLAGLRLTLIGLEGAAKADGSTEYKFAWTRVRRGPPINRHQRAVHGHEVAGWVEREVAAGKQQEQAVLEAVEKFSLSRAEVFSWLAHRRRWAGKSPNSQD